MIVGFADKATQDLWDGTDSKDARSIPKVIWGVARRKLDMIDAAQALMDLRAPPANRLEKLQGSRVGAWSIRINDQFRITFKWNHREARDVKIEDYH
jgi:toxin HigB-1